jgi:hypothetical protein
MKRKCEFQKRDGQRYGADAQSGKTLCVFHVPAQAAAGRRARRLGGINRSRATAVLPSNSVPSGFPFFWDYAPCADAFSCLPSV